ncbi:hypothetical protein [Sphingorhabdus sp.]|uniref:hypothetical protein n=1 Tax=Sphingorhabdus sp. TaxID=1902408 RepID=UPI0032B71806
MSIHARSTRPRLFASTRVIARPHIGTFFGWIKPIAELSQRFDVTLLLCDHQSFDGSALPVPDVTQSFRAALQAYFPDHVSIVVESEIVGLEALVPLFLRLASARPLLRNPTLKALEARGELTLGHIVYPLLMAADLVACQPDEVLTSPDGFRYFEYPFALQKRVQAMFDTDGEVPRVRTLPAVKITDDMGERLRRSSQGPVLGDAPDDTAAIERWLLERVTPTPGPASERWLTCRAPKSVWTQVKAAPPCDDLESVKCEGCLEQLASTMRSELAAFSFYRAAHLDNDRYKALNASNRRLDAIFTRWHARATTTDAHNANAVVFLPIDLAEAEIAAWISLSFARRSVLTNECRTTFDIVLMPPLNASKLTGSEAAAMQMERLVLVGEELGIDCRITTCYHALKPVGGLSASMYRETMQSVMTAIEGLQRAVDRHLRAVLMERYKHADQLDLTSDDPVVDERKRCSTYPSASPNVDAWRLLKPVARRLYDRFEDVIRRYPSATALIAGEEAAASLTEIYRISTEWWGEQPDAEEFSCFSDMKGRIVRNFKRIWRH